MSLVNIIFTNFPLSYLFQLEKFRALQDSHGQSLTHNFRPIQPLGDRVVLFNTKDIDTNALDNGNNVEQPPPSVDESEKSLTKIEADAKNEYETVDGSTEQSGDDIDRTKPDMVEIPDNVIDQKDVKEEDTKRHSAKPLKGAAWRLENLTLTYHIVWIVAVKLFC